MDPKRRYAVRPPRYTRHFPLVIQCLEVVRAPLRSVLAYESITGSFSNFEVLNDKGEVPSIARWRDLRAAALGIDTDKGYNVGYNIHAGPQPVGESF